MHDRRWEREQTEASREEEVLALVMVVVGDQGVRQTGGKLRRFNGCECRNGGVTKRDRMLQEPYSRRMMDWCD